MSSAGYDYDVSDPTFLDDLRASQESVQVVARWLSGKGYPVIVRPTFERPTADRMGEFADNGDLEIVQRVEVKQRQSLTFTSKQDFPYPTLIVDACHCFDRARPKPYAYVIVNREMTAAFIVYVRSSFKHWRRVTKNDRVNDRAREFYECPLEHVSEVAFA